MIYKVRVLLSRRISKTAPKGHFMTNSDKKDNSDNLTFLTIKGLLLIYQVSEVRQVYKVRKIIEY